MIDEHIYKLASRQYGSFNRAQLLALGCTDRMIAARLASRRWVQVAPGVYALPGFPDSWWRRIWIAHLDVGTHSVVSHESAGQVRGLPLFSSAGKIVLTVPHGDHERRGPFEVRQSTDLKPEHVSLVAGLPVTTPVRTYFDLAATHGHRRARFERSVDMAAADNLIDLKELSAFYDELKRPGKKGMRLLGQVVSYRGAGYVPPDSELGRWLRKAIRLAGLPEPQWEAALPWRPKAERRVDGLWSPGKIIVEGDGRRWHQRRDSMLEDRRRDREAQNHGYRIYRFLWEEVRYDQAMVAETLRIAHGLAA